MNPQQRLLLNVQRTTRKGTYHVPERVQEAVATLLPRHCLEIFKTGLIPRRNVTHCARRLTNAVDSFLVLRLNTVFLCDQAALKELMQTGITTPWTTVLPALQILVALVVC